MKLALVLAAVTALLWLFRRAVPWDDDSIGRPEPTIAQRVRRIQRGAK